MIRISFRRIPAIYLFVTVSMTVSAQFKQTPPAPYPPSVAHQKIRMLLESADPDNPKPTADKLSDLLAWYRDIVDEELIAAWTGDHKAQLPALMPMFADSRVATAIVEISWRQQRPSTFQLAYASMLGDLMARYPGSADPLIRDLTGPVTGIGQMPDLSPSEAEAVCRILLDMPETANWKKKIARQILPQYRSAAQNLLLRDFRGEDREKSYRAQLWLTELRLNVPGAASEEDDRHPKLMRRSSPGASSGAIGDPLQSETLRGRPHIVEQSPASVGSSGTLKCVGGPVAPNAEYVFPGMPLGNLQIELDGKPWDARLVPGNGQVQSLILVNRSSSAQKSCTVRWKVIP